MASDGSGGPTRMSGVVRAAESPLVAKLSKRACVYWDVREGLDAEPRESGRQNFWIENDAGKVLVLGEHMNVDARAQRKRELLKVADADIKSLSARLGEVKKLLRRAGGSEALELREERERLALTATFLHATRAHAKGKIHISGSAAHQEEWIRQHAAGVTSGPGTKTATMTIDSWEVVIEEGQEVTVEGACSVESSLPELEAGDGYRSRPTARVFRGTSAAPLVLTGIGAIAPAKPEPGPARRVKLLQTGGAPLKTWLMLGLFAVIIIVFALSAR